MRFAGEVGLASELREAQSVARVERDYPLRFGRGSLPTFWPDADVRRFLIAEHRFLTLDMAREKLIAAVGAERTPSRAAIGRFWTKLDVFWSVA